MFSRNPKGQFTKVVFPETDAVFETFAINVIKDARRNLLNNKHRRKYKKVDNTGRLSKSLSADTVTSGKDFILRFWAEDYADFIDQGVRGSGKTVRGAKAGKNKAPRSKFKYRSKMPPRGDIDRWGIMKNIKGTRDSKGKFVNRKSLMYLIQRSIFQRGIEPTYFFSDSFNKYYDSNFITKVEDAYSNDIENEWYKETIEDLKQ
jgi:hypothetical protein